MSTPCLSQDVLISDLLVSDGLVYLKLNDSNGAFLDGTVIYLDEGATINFDSNYDALKFSKNDAYICSVSEDSLELSINALPYQEVIQVPLRFSFDVLSQGTITMDSLCELGVQYYTYIIDDHLDSVVELLPGGSYSFVRDFTNGEEDGRLSFLISTIPYYELIAYRIDQEEENVIVSLLSENTIAIQISSDEELKNIKVYNFSGVCYQNIECLDEKRAVRLKLESGLTILYIETSLGVYRRSVFY